MKLFVRLACVGLGAVIATAALAQGAPSPKEQAQMAVDTRQSVMTLQGWSMGPIAGMLRKQREFDAEVVETSARRIMQLAMMVEDAFQMDTRKFDIETEALDTIWQSQDEFNSDAQNLVDAARNLMEAAQTGNAGKTLKAAAVMGKACGACHDNFRSD